jgi:hypothetical protein
VRQNHQGLRRFPIRRARERATELCGHPEHVEVICGDERSADAHRICPGDGDGQRVFPITGDAYERAGVALKLEKIGGGVGAFWFSHAGRIHRDDVAPVRVRQGAEQHAVDDAEDGGVGTDADRERDHGDGGESPVP